MIKRSKPKPTIGEFQKKDASKIAELYNSFDKEGLWPGGFTGGVPYTAERVVDSWPVAYKYITILISKLGETVTGVCSLHPHYEDKEGAYIGLLGVHPDFLGKGHGKALILKSLQIASEKGLRRVDLHTWAGNLRAVPLYKKCGLFWVPDTSVEMHDYIPGILNFPLAKEFFERHDWYSTQIRKLELKPDKLRLGEMEVFVYEFAEGKDELRVWVDRYGRGILGIEQVLDGQHLKICAELQDHKVISGVEQTLTITISNGTQKDMYGSVFFSGFEGLTFTAHPEESFKVKNKDSIQIEAKFKVSPEVEVPHIERKQKYIKANLIIEGKPIPLEIGLRILPLLQFRTIPETVVVTPGEKGPIHFSVFNNSKERYSGNLFIVDEQNKLSLKKTKVPLSIPPKSHFGFELGVEIGNQQLTEPIPLRLLTRGKIRGEEADTREETVYIKSLNPGGITVTEENTEYGRAVLVENEDLLACIRLRKAGMDIIFKDTKRGRQKVFNNCRFEVGPPFGFARPFIFNYEVRRNIDCVDLTLTSMHPDKPGVKMSRTLTFYAGASIIKETVKVLNMNPKISYRLGAHLCEANGTRAQYTMIVPMDEIREHEMIEFPVSESDLPTDPNAYKESWVCFQNHPGDYSLGIFWSKESLKKVKFEDYPKVLAEYDLGEVGPGQSVTTPEFYYVMKRGGWQGIHRKWKQLVEKKLRPPEETAQSKPLFNISLANTILFNTNPHQTSLEVTNFRNKKIDGEITILPPPKWKITPSKTVINDVSKEKPFKTALTLTPPPQAKLGIHSGKIRLTSPNQITEYPLDLCIISEDNNGKVSIKSQTEQDQKVFKISNGLIHFKSSAACGGCLYFLGKDKVNQLATTFPEMGTRVFLQNYSGGIRALWIHEDFDLQKSQTHKEKFTVEKIREHPWSGVKYSYQSKKQDELKGTTGAISYLTLPFSNLVKIRREFNNPTKATFHFTNCIWLSPQVGGNFQQNEVIFPRRNQIMRYRRAKGFPVAEVNPEKGWLIVRNEKKNTGLSMITGDTLHSNIFSLDIGKTLLELFIRTKIRLQPGESTRIEDYIVLDRGNIETTEKLANTLRLL